MPEQIHDSAEQYAHPTVIYALLVTAGRAHTLRPFSYSTDLEELREVLRHVNGVVVQIPVVDYRLPDTKDWLT